MHIDWIVLNIWVLVAYDLSSGWGAYVQMKITDGRLNGQAYHSRDTKL